MASRSAGGSRTCRRFAKYLGGSPANTAVGRRAPRPQAGMLTRVGDEHNGRFVRETLAAEGVDVSHVTHRPQAPHRAGVPRHPGPRHLPAGVLPRPLRRHGARAPTTSTRAFIASATRAAALRHAPVAAADLRGLPARRWQLARAAGTRVVLDIDYRPVLWGLTSPGMGEQRFVPSDQRQRASANRDLPHATWWSAPRRRSTSPAAAPTAWRRCGACAR